ncbi:MAG: SpoIIE family protein phosphatase [Campylobacteraceae bacterium]|nr:SpoIIE family protein phosphatase [Campylobacteraceae bacterium]
MKNYELIKHLQPEIKNIYTIVDDTTTGKKIQKEVQSIIKNNKNKDIHYEILNKYNLKDLELKVRSLPKNSAVLLTFFFRTKDNKYLKYDEVSKLLSNYSNAPVYGTWDFTFEKGILGGYLTSALFQGKEAGLMAIKVLNGTKIEDIPVLYNSPNAYMFDYNKLNKYNINIKNLPKDSYIINKPISFYDTYKIQILSIFILMFFMLLIILLLFRNIHKIKLVEKKISKQLTFQQHLIDSIDVPIYYKNIEGIYLGCNEAFSKFFNKHKDDIIGKNVYDIFPNELAKDTDIKDKELFKNGKNQKYERSHSNSNASGNVYTILFKRAFSIEKEEIAGLIGTIFDITKMKNSANELDLLNKSLESKIEERTKALVESNIQVKDSIASASLIQTALIATSEQFEQFFPSHFSLWQPKDIVGGDIILLSELRHEEECMILLIDCTGHGVPGAFLTMLVKALEQRIRSYILAKEDIEFSPSTILSYYNKTLKKMLKQNSIDSKSNVGFDGGVIYYDKRRSILRYSGANCNLHYIEDEECKTFKASRYSVGYTKCDNKYIYKEISINVKPGMKFYLTSDGYLDQNGGEKNFPFGKRRFVDLIKNNHNLDFDTQKKLMKETFIEYKAENEATDDVAVIGLCI